jgi:folylpolyglutamate synthase
MQANRLFTTEMPHADARTFEATVNALYDMQANSEETTKLDAQQKDKANHARLQQVRECLDCLGVDLTQLKVIHVTGTTGKGSTCTFLESILREASFQTGMFASPHLVTPRERIRLNGHFITEAKFLDYFWDVHGRLQEGKVGFDDSGRCVLPFFTFMTVMAYRVFFGEKVDVAIMEVGVGGRYDATNVVPRPVCSAVTMLDLDHTHVLGNTLREIAREKAGIFKEKVPAFTLPQSSDVLNVLMEEARHANASGLYVVDVLPPSILHGQQLGIDGEHQWANASLAVHLASTFLKAAVHPDDLPLKLKEQDGAPPTLIAPTTLPPIYAAGLVKARLAAGRTALPPSALRARSSSSTARTPLCRWRRQGSGCPTPSPSLGSLPSPHITSSHSAARQHATRPSSSAPSRRMLAVWT